MNQSNPFSKKEPDSTLNISFIENCARCGKSHKDLVFTILFYPIKDTDGTIWEWWTPCPFNKQPILLKSVTR